VVTSLLARSVTSERFVVLAFVAASFRTSSLSRRIASVVNSVINCSDALHKLARFNNCMTESTRANGADNKRPTPVLAVDDMESIRTYMPSGCSNDAGYAVVGASDGRDGLRRLVGRAHVKIRIPRAAGTTTCERRKAERKGVGSIRFDNQGPLGAPLALIGKQLTMRLDDGRTLDFMLCDREHHRRSRHELTAAPRCDWVWFLLRTSRVRISVDDHRSYRVRTRSCLLSEFPPLDGTLP
jgi:hypothetical protein